MSVLQESTDAKTSSSFEAWDNLQNNLLFVYVSNKIFHQLLFDCGLDKKAGQRKPPQKTGDEESGWVELWIF